MLFRSEMGEVQDAFADIDVGSYPYFKPGASGTSIVLRGSNIANLDAALAAITEKLQARDIEIWAGDHK